MFFSVICTINIAAHLLLMAGWLLVAVLFVIVLYTKPPEPFDPYEILQLSPGAEVEDVKKQYRKLSRKYHPDLNPDPEAQEYFLLLTNARDALADDVGRENYEKYGHPDGRQSMKIGIALPSFIFQSGRLGGTIILFSLVAGGILLPVFLVLFFLRRTGKFTKNGVLLNTAVYYMHLMKPQLGVTRIAEVFVYAMEIMDMKVKAEHEAPMAQLEKAVKQDLSKSMEDKLSKLRTSIVKAYMLLIAYTSRKMHAIPSKLIPDLKYILNIAPKLFNEMLGITITYHWLSPSIAIFEFSQCLVQAISPSSMHPVGKNAKTAEAALSLLQLPHFDTEVIKKLGRHKIRSIEELYGVGRMKRQEELSWCGFKAIEIEDVESALKAIPSCEVKIRCETVDEDEICEGDIMTIHVYVRLYRGETGSIKKRSQALREKEAKFLRKRQAVTAVAPRYPFEKKENWWILIADYRIGTCFTGMPASLIEAEALTLEHPTIFTPQNAMKSSTGMPIDKPEAEDLKGDTKGPSADESVVANGETTKTDADEVQSKKTDSPIESAACREDDCWNYWQCIDMKLVAPSKGTYEWNAMLMSDTWVGCNINVRFKFSVRKATGDNASRNFAKAVGQPSEKKNIIELDSDLESGGEDHDDEDNDNAANDDSDDYSDYSGTEESEDERDEDDDDDLITKDE